ncbi:MAG: polysaccharide pyruvyl transferase family protein [Hydrogenophilus sp.]|nr:polysaccharide pyruvyl transferase family protein [Hydrogenophilus sp.]
MREQRRAFALVAEWLRREPEWRRGEWFLFGAADRHNMGDLLLLRAARCWADQEGLRVREVGLRYHNLRGVGGARVEPFAAVWGRAQEGARMVVWHVGGAILETDAASAAEMLLPQREAAAALRWWRFSFEEAEREYARLLREAGPPRPFPYVAPPLPEGGRVAYLFTGVSGQKGLGDEGVRRALAEAKVVCVRDRESLRACTAAGVRAVLAPDPVEEMASEWGSREGWRRRGWAFRQRWGSFAAIQWAATAEVEGVAEEVRAGVERGVLPRQIVFFAMGLAPLHDSMEAYQRVAQRLRKDRVPVKVWRAAHRDSIAGLIAGAKVVAASSLHALILADRLGVPQRFVWRWAPERVTAYQSTWDKDWALLG